MMGFLFSDDGIRIAKADVILSGIALTSGPHGYQPSFAEIIEGTLLFTFADLKAAFARPEFAKHVLSGVSGVVRPDFSFSDGGDNRLRVTGSIDFLGRRFQLSASSRVRIEGRRLVVSAAQVEGLPMLGAIPVQVMDFSLPLSMPEGTALTGVTVVPDGLLVKFEGKDKKLG